MPSSSLIARSYSGSVGGLGAEARDDVVAGLAAADGVRELAASPVVHLEIPRRSEEAVKAAELVGDGGVFERRVEDVDRLVLARHALAILPLVVTAPRWLPEQEEGKCFVWPVRRPSRVAGTKSP